MYPSVPFTRIRCPSRISRVACSTPTTAGKPYSRAITAPWVIRPPTSVTRPVIATNRGDQLGSVWAVTRMSPASRSASAMSRMTRALPSMVPAETGKPIRAPAGTSSRRYDPQASQHVLFLPRRLLPPLLEAPLGGTRLEELDVVEDHGHERGGPLAPTRPRDVDLADAAHAVPVEVGLDGVTRFGPARE